MGKTRDRRLSVCIAAEVADELDERVAQLPEANRSRAVEEAIHLWLWDDLAQYPDKKAVLREAMKLYRQQQERELYRQYFAELNESARAELADWTGVAEDTACKHWPTYSDK